MTSPLAPSEGLGVLHLFGVVGPESSSAEIAKAVNQLAGEDGYQVAAFAVLGHKADIGLMALGPDLWRLRRFQTAVQQAGVHLIDSYVSLTEVSEYSKGMPEQMLHERLYPSLPPEGMDAICFYPMSKRRDPGQNWFTLPFEERKELMYGHGATGREFRGRVVQLITGSVGLDDYEWGVTLFGVRPDDLKEVVYKMRFDEASAKYADFGPFITGAVAPIDEVLATVGH